VSATNLRADIGRLLWIGFEAPAIDDDLRNVLAAGDAGGVTLFRRNLPMGAEGAETDLAALRELNDQLHAVGASSGDPLLISVDQEGGRVQRIKAPTTHYPPMFSFAAAPDAQAAQEALALGQKMAEELVAWGFDIDFAPVLDVHTNPANPIIGDRAFSDQPEAVALRALAFAKGLQAGGILSCGKHFPGHGDTATDSHLSLPRLDHDLGRLRAVELLPFVRAIEAKIPMIMTAHVVFAALDAQVPATLSRRVITGLLREELGFAGVIVSDDLDMKAIADNFGVGDAAIAAIEAGCDVLLLCRNREHQEEARTALHKEASNKSAFRDRVAQSASRVRRLRARPA
jgi:beta-N-acetylhexosaminidase